jgi:hypothetical protein
VRGPPQHDPAKFLEGFVVTARHPKFAAVSAVAVVAILALAPAASAGALLVETHSSGFFNPRTHGVQTGHINSAISFFGKLAVIPNPSGPGDGCGSRICGPGGGVPEPAAWTLMILGFGGVGLGLRAQRHCLNFGTRPGNHGPAIRGPLKDPASSSFGWIDPEWDTI